MQQNNVLCQYFWVHPSVQMDTFYVIIFIIIIIIIIIGIIIFINA